MSQFEFSRNITLGTYFPIESVFQHLDPRTRITIFFFLVLALTFTTRFFGLIIGIVVVVAAIFFSRVPIKYALRGLLPPLPFLIILTLLQFLIFPANVQSHVVIQWGPVRISQEALISGAVLFLRFIGLILALSLSTFVLSTPQIIHGLNSMLFPLAKLGLPVQDFVMMIQVTLSFLPGLARNAERIAKAQASRGVEWEMQGGLFQRIRQIIPIILPIFIISLRKAEMMALAMDSRGYGITPVRSVSVELKLQRKDYIIMVMVPLLVGVILGL